MRNISRLMIFVFTLVVALVIPMTAAAQEEAQPAPYVPAFDGCQQFVPIAGHMVCVNGYGGNVTVQGNALTFTHSPMPNGEGAMSLSVVSDGDGASEIQISGSAKDVYFYDTPTTAFYDRFFTNDYGYAVVTLPMHNAYTVFYVGALGAPGNTFTLTFGSIWGPDVPRGTHIDSSPYVWGF